MGGEHGTKNAGLVLDVLVEAGNVTEKVVADKGGVVSKLSHLSDLLDEGMTLMQVDMSELGKELTELDGEDLTALQERFKAKFDLMDDQVEALVEEGLDLAKVYGEAVVKTIAWVQKIRAAVKPEVPAA